MRSGGRISGGRATDAVAYRPIAVVASVATLELLLARITGGPLLLGYVIGGLLLAGLLAAALHVLRRLPPLGRAAVAAFPPAAYGSALLALPFFGRVPWWPVAALLGGGLLLAALWRGRGGKALGPRGAAGWLAAYLAATWGMAALVEGKLPPAPWMALAAAAFTAAVLLGGRALLLAPLALIPGLASESWDGEAPVRQLPDVLLITVDTLRLDAAREMKVWDRLADRGRAYEAQAPSPWTLPSLATLLTGLEPAAHGAGRMPRGFTPLPEAVGTLVERLRDAGYDTAATVQSPFGDPIFGLRQGFARFRSEQLSYWVAPGVPFSDHARPLGATLLSAVGMLSSPIHAARRVADVRDFVASRRDRPLFLWVHFLDAHIPYRHAWSLDLPFRDRLFLSAVRRSSIAPLPTARELDLLGRGYAHELEVIDRAIGQILHALPPGPRGRIVVLTSDHGEEFGEHQGWEHGHTMFQELLAVPLIISGIDGLQPGDAGLIDLAPTLAGALGIPAEGLDGRDLRVAGPDVPYRSTNPLYGGLNQRAVRLGTRKLIAVGSDRMAFDLDADPGEQKPFPNLERMESYLPPASIGREGVLPLDPEVESALRALDYLEER